MDRRELIIRGTVQTEQTIMAALSPDEPLAIELPWTPDEDDGLWTYTPDGEGANGRWPIRWHDGTIYWVPLSAPWPQMRLAD